MKKTLHWILVISISTINLPLIAEAAVSPKNNQPVERAVSNGSPQTVPQQMQVQQAVMNQLPVSSQAVRPVQPAQSGVLRDSVPAQPVYSVAVRPASPVSPPPPAPVRPVPQAAQPVTQPARPTAPVPPLPEVRPVPQAAPQPVQPAAAQPQVNPAVHAAAPTVPENNPVGPAPQPQGPPPPIQLTAVDIQAVKDFVDTNWPELTGIFGTGKRSIIKSFVRSGIEGLISMVQTYTGNHLTGASLSGGDLLTVTFTFDFGATLEIDLDRVPAQDDPNKVTSVGVRINGFSNPFEALGVLLGHLVQAWTVFIGLLDGPPADPVPNPGPVPAPNPMPAPNNPAPAPGVNLAPVSSSGQVSSAAPMGPPAQPASMARPQQNRIAPSERSQNRRERIIRRGDVLVRYNPKTRSYTTIY